MMKISQHKLQAACDVLSALVPECRLTIDAQGWNTQAVDTANVAMVSLNLPKAQFEQYDENGKCEIGMDLLKWKDLLKIMNERDSTIEIVRDGTQLKITDGRYSILHTPLDPNTLRKRPNPPNINLPASYEVEAKDLMEAIKAMGVIGDKVWLTAKQEGLALDAEGDTDKLNKVLDCPVRLDLWKGEVSSLFSLDYLTDIAKAMKDAGKVTILIGKDHPVRFDCAIEGMDVSYLVAPRIEDGE